MIVDISYFSFCCLLLINHKDYVIRSMIIRLVLVNRYVFVPYSHPLVSSFEVELVVFTWNDAYYIFDLPWNQLSMIDLW